MLHYYLWNEFHEKHMYIYPTIDIKYNVLGCILMHSLHIQRNSIVEKYLKKG